MIYNWISLVIGVVIFGFGVYRVYLYFVLHKKIRSSGSWPKTVGTVTEAKIVTETGTKGGKTHYPKITYHYSIIGMDYSRYARIKGTIFRDTAAEYMKSFPAGSILKISYNPENPNDCISEIDEEEFPWLGLALIAAGLLFMLGSFFPSSSSPHSR